MKRILSVLLLLTFTMASFAQHSGGHIQGIESNASSGSSGTVPNTVSGMLAWYKSDAGIGLTSGTVSTWNDQVGSFHMIEWASGSRPTVATGINGIQKLVFTSDGLQTQSAVMSGSTDYTIMWVGNAGWGHGLDNAGSGWGIQAKPDGAGIVFTATSLAGYFVYHNNTSGNGNTAVDVYILTIDQTVGGTSTLTFYKNGTQTGQTTMSNSTIRSSTKYLTIGLNSNASPPTYRDGDFYEWGAWNRVLNSTEITGIANYAKSRYGL